MDSFMSFDGVDLAFTDSGGEGAALIMLHGFTGSSRINWVETGVYEKLTGSGRRIVMLDARGHGESEKPHASYSYWNRAMARDVNELAENLGLREYDLLGYSMGAKVSIETAVMYRQVRGLVLTGLSIYERDWKLGEAERRERVSEMLEGKLKEKKDAGEFNIEGDRKAFAARLEGSIFPEYTHSDLRNIKKPVLVLNGAKDYDAEKAASFFPNARGISLDGDHHSVITHVDFTKEILDFLDMLD
jgi:pimeloyl-ACP methyl ester carboxylesterase